MVTDQNGMVHLSSAGSVEETLSRLESLLVSKGIRLFCRVDHSGEAARAGMAMRPTVLLIFGSPETGTPLMLAAPSLALDLPLKALVWQAADGATRLSYNTTEYLRARHALADNAHGLLAAEHLLAQAAALP